MILNYLRDQYLAVVIIVMWILFMLHNQNKNSILVEQVKELERGIVILKERDHESSRIIDSLSKVDTLIVNRIKTIKEKEYVQIRIVDSLPVSGLQQYFSDNYPKR